MNFKFQDIFQRLQMDKAYLIGGCAFVLATSYLNIVQPGIGYAITANGEFVGYAASPFQLKGVLNTIEKNVQEENGKDSSYNLEVEYTAGKMKEKDLTDTDTLIENIESTLEVMVPGVIIKAGSEAIMAVDNVDTANMVLEKIKQPFKSIAEDVEIEFAEDVEILNVEQVYKQDIHSQSLALSVVSSDDSDVVTRSNNRNIIDSNTSKLENPLIDVRAKFKFKGIEEIPIPVETIENPYLKAGSTIVHSNGSVGSRDVSKMVTTVNNKIVAEEIFSEVILKEATPKIIYKGTGELYTESMKVVDYAKQFIGVKYRFGGVTPSGFDCSGFTSYVYREFGITLPRTSSSQGTTGTAVSYSQAIPGDLIVFSGHVGIYVGNGNMIHSPRPGKSVMISPIATFGKSVKSVRRLI